MTWLIGLDWGIQWGTVFTVVGTLTAAYLGQFFSHRYSQKREEIKQKKESFQNLYSPVIFKILNYLELEEEKQDIMFIKELDEIEFNERYQYDELSNPSIEFKKILEIVGSNLKYGSLDLIREHQETLSIVKRNETYEGHCGTQLYFCSVFISDYINLSKDIGVYSKRMEKSTEGALLLTRLEPLVTEIGGSIVFVDFLPWFFGAISSIDNKDKYLTRVLRLYLQYAKVKNKIARQFLIKSIYKTLIDIGKDFDDRYEWEYEVWVKFINTIQPFKAISGTNKKYKQVVKKV
ncbi:hypothetical protein JNUCC22_19265 [Bacillus sp. JNUCC-22]|uniref:hypothetical protein n=1 Tax=Bacillus sp. JNUCC-22 TaxID=2842457 RepID=UPI001C08BD07|nr:hypothetical protein [Bacillus sp. JNUCC-22]QWQ28442.1 hypothetical protein JNUCC22_19265 [Bacillus sp. JNUCC-22]